MEPAHQPPRRQPKTSQPAEVLRGTPTGWLASNYEPM